MSDVRTWESKFRPYELIQYIDDKKLVDADPTADVGSDRPVPTYKFGKFIADLTVYHRHKVLLPYARCWPILTGLRSYCTLDYWMIEPDPKFFNELLDNDDIEPASNGRFYYDMDLLWKDDPIAWADEFDPEAAQADALISIAPLNVAADTFLALWDFLRPRGQAFTMVAYSDLFGRNEWSQEFRAWCAAQELYYGVPTREYLDTGSKVVAIFGEKRLEVVI